MAVLDFDVSTDATAATGTDLEQYVQALTGLVLDRLGVPFMMLDANGGIVLASAAAEAILDDGRHIARDAHNRLVCQSRTTEDAVGRFLEELAASADMDFLLQGHGPEAPLFASLATFQPPPFARSPAIAPVAVLFIRQGDLEEGIAVARLLHGLSETETGTLRAIVSGVSIKQHAEQRQVSVHTVRKQLNAAMKKTGVSSQLELQTLIHDLTRRPVSAVRG